MNPIALSRYPMLTVLLALTVLSGCAAVGPNYEPPDVAVPTKFDPRLPADTSVDAQAPLPGSWWELLGDETLADLIRQAATRNLDIRIAQSRLVESRAGRKAAKAAQLPSVSAGGTVSTQQASENSPFVPNIPPQFGGLEPRTDLFQAGFDASWEIDIFGGVRRSVEAAEARYQAADDQRQL